MKIPWLEFQLGIVTLAPDCKTQAIAPAPYVFVFSRRWLQEEFWPHWCAVKRELNRAIPVRPMTNNARRRICEEINKRFIAELTLATRIAMEDDDVAPAAVEVSVDIQGGPLNLVSDDLHRCALLELRDDNGKRKTEFVEPQLDYENYQSTPLAAALARGTRLIECWM